MMSPNLRVSSSRLQKNQCGCQGSTKECTYQEIGHCVTFRTLVSTGNLNRAEMFKREGATYNHAGRRLVGNGGLGGAGVVLRGIDV
jgi:hypothetical protein